MVRPGRDRLSGTVEVDESYENRDEAAKMGERGMLSVFEKYNCEKEQDKLLKVYEELLN